MSEVKWFKIYNDFFENKKIKSIKRLKNGEKILICWINLLCLASKNNDYGHIYITKKIPYSIDDLVSEFGYKKALVEEILNKLEIYEMININNGFINILNWEEYQNSEGLDRIRKQTNERVKKYRNKQKSNADVTLQATHCNATDKEEDKDLNNKEKIYKKEIYGEFKNVSLSDEEYSKLQSSNLLYIIDKLSLYIESTGKKYKSHYATILSWSRKEPKQSIVQEFKQEEDNLSEEERLAMIEKIKNRGKE